MAAHQNYGPEELSEAALETIKGGVTDFTVWREPLGIVELAGSNSKLVSKTPSGSPQERNR